MKDETEEKRKRRNNGMTLSTRDKEILHIALPAIVTNITVPLLGLVDMGITGHLGRAAYIGAIAVGSTLFNVIYWVFGFLRMGTSGMTAQAYGRGDSRESLLLLLRAATVGLGLGLAIVLLQRPLFTLAVAVMGVDAGLIPLVRTYYGICVWGAPAMLCLYGLTGWFIGMQNTRITMTVSIIQNVVNIVASVCLVYGMGLTLNGVAAGTVTAQYAGLAAAAVCAVRHCGTGRKHVRGKDIVKGEALRRFFTVNRDIFLRTLFLVAVNLFFVSAGARQGTVMLAVNTLLMQLFTLFSYVMDGFAYAGEALCGKYAGAGCHTAFRLSVRHLFGWGTLLTAVYTAVYALGGMPFLSLLTDQADILASARHYMPWATAIPAAGMAAFILDGIFIGTTRTHDMLASSAMAATAFFVLYAATAGTWHNHGLWLAFIVYLALRGIIQGIMFRKKAFA